MTDTVTVYGSYGSLEVDRTTGSIIKRNPDEQEFIEPGVDPYGDIVSIDPKDIADPQYASFDIAHVGFTTDTGAYIEAEPYLSEEEIHAPPDPVPPAG